MKDFDMASETIEAIENSMKMLTQLLLNTSAQLGHIARLTEQIAGMCHMISGDECEDE